MIFNSSRSHWMAAPATKTEPSSAYSTLPSRPHAMVVTRPFSEKTGLFAGVHQQESAGTIGILRFAGTEAGLTEQRRLLIARQRPQIGIGPPSSAGIGLAIDCSWRASASGSIQLRECSAPSGFHHPTAAC